MIDIKKIKFLVSQIEASMEITQEQLTVLREELLDGGASGGSLQKGLAKKEMEKIIARRNRNRKIKM